MPLATVLETLCLPLFRRIQFRGKGRLRSRLPVATAGIREVSFRGGFRLRLDLRESLQRDFLFGLYDFCELRLLRQSLRDGGDVVDVGAHIGMYSVAAAVAVQGRGRVLAFEPNPEARSQLLDNVKLNRVNNVIVLGRAASDRRGVAALSSDVDNPSFSTLDSSRLPATKSVGVETTTVDEEVARYGLVPAAVKVDVEGLELAVLAGMSETLKNMPVVICEVSAATSRAAADIFASRGYRAFRVSGGRLVPGIVGAPGTFNAVFQPSAKPLPMVVAR